MRTSCRRLDDRRRHATRRRLGLRPERPLHIARARPRAHQLGIIPEPIAHQPVEQPHLSSPPDPLLPPGEGELTARSESRPQNSFEVFSAHVLVAYSNDSIARTCEKRGTCAIVDLLSCFVVRTSLEFDHHALAGTVKVDDEPVQHVLPSELQTEYPPIAQQRPRVTFGGSGSTALLTGDRESLRWSEASKRIHDPRMPMRLRVETTRIPRVRSENMRANSPFVPPLPKGEGDGG